MTDSDTDDGIELEASPVGASSSNRYATDETKLRHLTGEQRGQVQKLSRHL